MSGRSKAPGMGQRLTPTVPQRRPAPAAPDSTRNATLAMPGAGAGPLKTTGHTRPAVVTGPPAWENGRDPVYTPAGDPPLHGTSPGQAAP